MTRRIGYASVSSREQQINSHALEQQIARLKAEGIEEIYYDVKSGYKHNRGNDLEKVLGLVRSRLVDEVVATRVDRLSRRGSRSFQIFEEFIKADVVLKCLDEQIDLSNAAGKMVAGVLAVMAQHHSDQKCEAVSHGWAHLRARKVAMNPPFGYHKVNDRHELDTRPFLCLLDGQQEQSKATIARSLVDAYLEVGTLRGAIRWLNVTYGISTTAHSNKDGEPIGGRMSREMFRFSVTGLANYLTNAVLLGHTQYLAGRSHKHRETIIHYDTHPDHRLITEEERQRIDELLAYNKRVKGYGSTRLKYPLSGLVFCAECQSAHYSLVGGKNSPRAKRLNLPPERNYYFQCKNWRTRGCTQKTMIRMDIAEAHLVEALQRRSQQIADIADRPDEIAEPPELIALRSELMALKGLPNQSRVMAQVVEVESQIETVRRSLQQSANQYSSNQQGLQQTFSSPKYWESLEAEERQQLYRGLVSRVVVRDGAIERIDLKV